MAIRTQGTHIYVLANKQVTRIKCIDDLDPGEDSLSRLEDTCLDETVSKTYVSGLLDPAEGSITVKFDPNNSSHIKLIELAEAKADCHWYIGSSGSEDAPAYDASADKVTLPATRTWWHFTGSLSPASPKFGKDTLVEKSYKLTRTSRMFVVPMIPADTTAPAAPVISSFDGTTATGTAETGSTVKILDASDNELGAATADSSGNFTVTLSTAVTSGNSVTATATDTAGNTSAKSAPATVA